ncbi:hypothetical protein AYO38_08850 [bacterium SCGC AG-212-C10]|nr:hypothetical protein AYO38_08850 [bacterium SCGC AG-212-C10]
MAAEVNGPHSRVPEGAPSAEPVESDERLLDETIDDSFPASDPPSFTPVTGSRKPAQPKHQ